MKAQIEKQGMEKKLRRPPAKQGAEAAAPSKPTRQARPSFDDLHACITARAYELYVERGYREGGSLQDWVDAEEEVLSREFPASTTVDGDMSNEQQRFAQLYLDHVQTVTRFARHLCDQEESVEDLVQETFLNAFCGYRRFLGDSKPSTWLYAIAARACSRMHRKHAGEPSRLLSLEDVQAAHNAVTPSALQTGSPTPEEEAHQAQLRRQLERAVTLLPPHYQRVLLLRDIDGLSTRSVSAHLGLGERAVKSRLHRARRFIRRRLTGAGWNAQDVDSGTRPIAGS